MGDALAAVKVDGSLSALTNSVNEILRFQVAGSVSGLPVAGNNVTVA